MIVLSLFSVPPSLIGQWEMEFKKAVKAGKLTMLVYTGDIKSRIEKQKGSNKECAKSFIGAISSSTWNTSI